MTPLIESWPSAMARRAPSDSRRRWAPGRAALQVKSFFDSERAETDQEADRHHGTSSIVPKLDPSARDLLPAWPPAGRGDIRRLHSGQSARLDGPPRCQVLSVGTVVAFGVSFLYRESRSGHALSSVLVASASGSSRSSLRHGVCAGVHWRAESSETRC